MPTILDDTTNELTDFSRSLFQELYNDFAYLDSRIKSCDTKIATLFKSDERCQRIGGIPGIGDVTATALISAIGDLNTFKNGRAFSAWIGLVLKQASSGQKQVLKGISKSGNSYLRKLLIHGARSIVFRSKNKTDHRNLWIKQLKNRRGMNKAVVAVANKNARIIWALLTKNEHYREAT